MVVPASSVPGRNATPQPMPGAQGQHPGGNQAGPNQPGRPVQQSFNFQQAQQMKMDQAAAQSQAQIRAHSQAKQMQGQPGGLGGPGAVSQSPGMNTLNTPVRRTPVEGQPMGQVGGPFGQTLDPRFNQNAQRPQMPMGANVDREQILQQILASVPNEKRQQLMSLPVNRLNEVIGNWQAGRPLGQQMPGRPQPQQQGGQLD